MQTIKNLLNPGGKEDDELLYGNRDKLTGEEFGHSGTTTTTGPGTGTVGNDGSSGATDSNTAAGTGLQNTTAGTGNTDSRNTNTNTTTTRGPHSSNLANRADPRVDTHQDTSHHTTGSTGAGVGGAQTTSSNPYSSKQVDSRLGGSNNQATSFPDSTTGQGRSEYNNPTNIGGAGHTSGGNTGDLNNPTNTEHTSGSGHHLGRDAAALGTAGAVGEGVHHHRENERDVAGTGNTAGVGHNTTSTSGPHSSNLANKADPTVDSDRDGSRALGSNTNTAATSHDNHSHSHSHGTETAAAGAAAAAAAGSHHHNTTGTGAGYTGTTPSGQSSSYHGGPTGTAVGPHDTTTANRLDPNLSSNTNMPPIEDASKHHPESGGGAESADLAHKDTSKLTGSERAIGKEEHLAGGTGSGHHYGRDAAGAGAIGTAGYEAEKHHGKHENATTGTFGTSHSTGKEDHLASGTGSGHHYGRDAAGAGAIGTAGHEAEKHHGKHDNTTTGTSGTSDGKDHHYGRDAAGVGAVGAAGYEAEKHHGKHDNATTGTSGTSHSTGKEDHLAGGTGSGHHYGRDAAGAGAIGTAGYEAEKHHGKHDNTTTGTSGTSHSTGQDHHHGREAAGVGAVGAGGYEADKHIKGHESGASTTSAAATGPVHGSKILNVLDPRVKTTGIGATKEGKEAEAQRVNSNESATGNDHHYGRDAAGVGAVGAAGYEADKHHKHHEAEKGATTGTGSTGSYATTDSAAYSSSKGMTNRNAYADPIARENKGFGASSDRHAEHSIGDTTGKDHHNGRDAAGVGAVGAAGYEAEKHHGHHGVAGDANKSLPTAPGNHGIGTGAGTQNALPDRTREAEDLAHEKSLRHGDKLHGVERNRGVSTGVTSGDSPSTTSDHHYGRDAAGTGAVGAAGYEAEKHHKSHEHEHGQSTGGIGSHNITDTSNIGTTNDRNCLHKDPPASHPASGLTGTGTGYGDNSSGYGKTSTGTGYDEPSGGNYGATTGQSAYGESRSLPRSEQGITGDQHTAGGVPGGKEARKEAVEQGEQNLDGKTGVEHSGEGRRVL